MFDVLKKECVARGWGLNEHGGVNPLAKVGCGAVAGVMGVIAFAE